MHIAMIEKFGRISPFTKPSALRYFYRELTGDQAATSTTEQEVDNRIKQIVDMEDPSVLPDLGALNSGQTKKLMYFEKSMGCRHIDAAVDNR